MQSFLLNQLVLGWWHWLMPLANEPNECQATWIIQPGIQRHTRGLNRLLAAQHCTASLLPEVPVPEKSFSESRSSAEGIRCEWQTVFSHLNTSGETMETGPLQILSLPWLLPTLKLIDFPKYLLYPFKIFPGCPHSRLCFEAFSECQRSWGNFYFPSIHL